LVNRAGTRHIDASQEPLTYFSKFLHDVRERKSTAMPEGYALKVMRIAIAAQQAASRGAGRAGA
jgi:hypothetical protein